MANVYKIVTDKIIKQLENGVIPWRKPWINANAVNWVSQKPYRGINTMLLEPGEYASKKQILSAGGWIKKEELKNYHIVVFWLWKEQRDEDTNELIKRFARPLYYKVWEINTQVTGLESKKEIISYDHNPIEKAEELKANYENAPRFSFNSGQAVYYPTLDKINCPPTSNFKLIEEFYCTLFHEMIHSTGHDKRLARPGITDVSVAFGDEVYSKEELVAEIGASMLCGIAGIDNKTLTNSASYIQSWLNALKEDNKLIVQAASQGQRAADYILGVNQDNTGEM